MSEQAGAQQQKVASGLRSVAQELHGMADGSQEPGAATDLARQAADKAHQVAERLQNRDPGALLDEVRSFARQRPGAYLAIALGAGVLAGRLTRGLTASTDDTKTSSTPKHAVPVSPAPGALTGVDPYPALPPSGFGESPTTPIIDPVTGRPIGGDASIPPPMPGLYPTAARGFDDIVGDPRS